jgi:hypothetical protein
MGFYILLEQDGGELAYCKRTIPIDDKLSQEDTKF